MKYIQACVYLYDMVQQVIEKKDAVTNVCYKFHDIIPDYCEQAKETEGEKVTKLLDILSRRDDQLLPVFYDALDETGQKHITAILIQQQGEHVLMIVDRLPTLSYFLVSSTCNRWLSTHQ